MQRLPWVLCCAWAAAQPRLTPSQQQVIDRARNASRNASDAAEEQIAAQFATLGFRMEMQLQGQGGRHLAMLSASALLQSLKGALAQLEWVTNFGLDAESLKAHPGESAFGIDTLARYGGRFPTMWELLAENSSLVADVSEKQWGVMEAAETGLYRLPPFAASPSRFSPPTVQEAQQRPRYLAGNTRRLPMGVRRYGAITAVLRNDVVRKRAVVVGSDSGGWESVCNHSVTPVHKPSWFLKVIEATSLNCEPIAKSPLGVPDLMMHTLLANSQTFRKVDGGLARQVYQLLEDADVRPLEGNMYMEGALLGPMRIDDVKVLVGSFPDLYGSALGARLRRFCAEHGTPLAWAVADGRAWPQEEGQKLEWLPWEPFDFWKGDGVRLLDPSAWPFTTANSSGAPAALWDQVWKEVEEERKQLAENVPLPRAKVETWWSQIKAQDRPLRMLRDAHLCSPDFCFGTFHLTGSQKCICRRSHEEMAMMI